MKQHQLPLQEWQSGFDESNQSPPVRQIRREGWSLDHHACTPVHPHELERTSCIYDNALMQASCHYTSNDPQVSHSTLSSNHGIRGLSCIDELSRISAIEYLPRAKIFGDASPMRCSRLRKVLSYSPLRLPIRRLPLPTFELSDY
jgi:hypothetical protein